MWKVCGHRPPIDRRGTNLRTARTRGWGALGFRFNGKVIIIIYNRIVCICSVLSLNEFVFRGVFQSLVEKHFPAPDRNRINRLLGLDSGKKTTLQSILDEENAKTKLTVKPEITATASGSKRKSNRQAAQKSKRHRRSNSSDVSGNDSDDAGDHNSDESDFKNSDSESEISEQYNSDDSNQSSDFNPFYEDSDSDADPWVSGRNKKKKAKKVVKAPSPKKKPQSTQDKIQELLTKKQTEVKPAQTNQLANGFQHYGPPPKDAIERACYLKEELLRKIEKLGELLPPNTLDQLIDELGGPDNVAEMTGRKGRVIQTDNGQIQYESRSEQDVPLETLNLTEKQRFMNGEKDVAIISEAASSGISLQSDRRVRNQRRRVRNFFLAFHLFSILYLLRNTLYVLFIGAYYAGVAMVS